MDSVSSGAAASGSGTASAPQSCTHCGHTHAGAGLYAGCQRLVNRVGAWNPCCSCLFSALPDALIVNEVFSYLDVVDLTRLSGVCTRWFYLGQDKRLWERVDLSSLAGTGVASPLAALPLHAQALQALRFAVPHLDDAELPPAPAVDAALPALTSLDLGGSSAVTGETVAALVAGTRVLRRLNLGGVVQLTDSDLAAILPSARNLRFLSLRDVAAVSDASVALIAATAPSLLALNLTGCPAVTAGAVVELLRTSTGRMRHLQLRGSGAATGAVLRAAARWAPQLLQLDAGSDDVVLGASDVGDSDVAELAAACGGLQVLSLQGQVELRDGKLAGALGRLRNLQRLDLTACEGVGDASVTAAALAAPGLTALAVADTGVGDSGLRALVSSRRLRSLDVARCAGVTLPALAALARKLPGLSHIMAGGLPGTADASAVAAAFAPRPVVFGHPDAAYAGRAAPQGGAPASRRAPALYLELV